MLSNYLKVAIRNITKHKFFSFINIFGLTIGIAACLFIVLYVSDELSYDHMHEKGAQIHRINLHGKLAGQDLRTTNSCTPLAKALVDEIPEVSEAIRVSNYGDWVFRYKELAFTEEDIFVADSNFFDFFSFRLIEGNPETVLKNPNSIVLTEKLAKKYFADESALGQTLILGNGKENYEVTGVVENAPGNSHLKFNALLSTSSFNQFKQPIWLNNSIWTYYRLNEQGDAASVDEKLEAITDRNVAPTLIQFMGKSLEEFKAEGGIYKYYSMPMYDIHLKSELSDENEAPGDLAYVYILVAIGIFILLIACINFMNLSTAQSSGRAKEVGLRKTLGSLRPYLIGQFLTESLIYSLLAGGLALAMVFFLLPTFNQMSGKLLTFSMLWQPLILLMFSAIIIFVGLMAGSYPAFYLTSFKITETLKGKIKAGMKSGSVRGVLVTFQFWISIVLIICTAIVYQQLQYVQNKNLGIDKEHIIMFNNTTRLDNNRAAFKVAMEEHSAVVSTSYSNNAIPGVNNTTIFRSAGNDADHILSTYFADHEHINTMGFEMADGRFFSRDFASDSLAVVLNKAAVAEFEWENPIGEKILNFNGDEVQTMEVIGVVEDFNFESLKAKVRPLIIQLTNTGNVLILRYNGNNPQAIIDYAQGSWDEYASGEPLEYTFLDDDFDALFRAEQRLGTVFTAFTIIAILIACLGLFGLAAFTAEQRTKEIGVRRAMGASVLSITGLMSKEFIKLVAIAFVLAIFPAYYIMDDWLQDFENKVEISYWIFALGGLLALTIACLTVSFQSFRAAKVDPVKSLRYE